MTLYNFIIRVLFYRMPLYCASHCASTIQELYESVDLYKWTNIHHETACQTMKLCFSFVEYNVCMNWQNVFEFYCAYLLLCEAVHPQSCGMYHPVNKKGSVTKGHCDLWPERELFLAIWNPKNYFSWTIARKSIPCFFVIDPVWTVSVWPKVIVRGKLLSRHCYNSLVSRISETLRSSS